MKTGLKDFGRKKQEQINSEEEAKNKEGGETDKGDKGVSVWLNTVTKQDVFRKTRGGRGGRESDRDY